MQIPIAVDRRFSRVTEVLGDPQFWIHEVVEIRQRATGSWSQSIGQNWDFDANAWDQVVRQGGDLEAIGIRLIEDQPVDNFRAVRDVVRQQREPE